MAGMFRELDKTDKAIVEALGKAFDRINKLERRVNELERKNKPAQTDPFQNQN